ncbi:MAG: glycosyltransferase family protein [Alphaproteobacteria bacterium]
MSARVLIYVQHLLGVGHLHRAALVARAVADAGMSVTLVSGGEPSPHADAGRAEVVQLPALRSADETFTTLIDSAGRPVDDSWKARRRDLLLALFARVRPHALVTETYPFGRRQLEFELTPLLDAALRAVPRPLVVSSVRDIVQRRSMERLERMAALVEERFDRVLVHGSHDFVPFDDSFALTGRIARKIHYTGYVAPPAAARGGPGDPGWDEVIVSAGGGVVGRRLLEVAIAARGLGRAREATWRLLAGHNLPEADYESLRGAAPRGVVVERTRPDFARLLANCAVSVSQGGYNTVAEVLAAGARAVIVPYAGRGETEQTLRATSLAARGATEVVNESALAPDTLARAVDRVLQLDGPRLTLSMDGARESARLLKSWLNGRD